MRSLFLCISILLWSFFTEAQQQRALIIGIDRYKETERAPFPQLDGCKNDAESMKILITAKYNFRDNQIKELYNEQATRENILKSINDLLDESQKGDVAFIFYAGHGSQVKNSLNHEDNHLDQSIVPVDTWKAKVPDIRNKELAIKFNKFIDKGVMLTCIFDCCHSGSIARGIHDHPPKLRYMPGSDWDAKDASNPIAPESRPGGKYLCLSAVQPDEFEEEQRDEQNKPHGAFTIAFSNAIKQQDVNGSVNNLFTATHAILRSNGIILEPVMACDPDRKAGTLFGLAKGKLSNKTLIPVLSVDGKNVKLQAGFVIGLNVENELISQVNGKTKIKITAILGPNLCEGKIIEGPDTIKPGEFFEVSNWVSSSAPFLKIYIPDSRLEYQKVLQYSKIVGDAKKSIHLINDFRNNDPDISFYYKNGMWWFNDPNKGPQQLKSFSESNLAQISGNQKANINIPPPQPLSDSLKAALSGYHNLQIVDNPNDAQYALFGTIGDNNNLEYGLVRTQLSSKDSLETMPIQTKIFELKANNNESYNYVTDSISEYIMRLSKVRGWLTIVPPLNDKFPYRLEVRSNKTNQVIGSEGIKVGDTINLYVVNEQGFASRWDGKQLFIYVFDIDQSGKMTLMYPLPYSGNINKFPKLDENQLPILEKKLEDAQYVGGDPGTDNYYCLATDEAIPNYGIVFNQEGVRGGFKGKEAPFADLVGNLGNFDTRAPKIIKTPASWVLQRIAVKTTQ